jgi:Methyltransferase domain
MAHRAIENFVYAPWFDNPICSQRLVSRDAYVELARDAIRRCYPEIDAFERETGFSIDQEWLHNLALHTQVVIKNSPICYAHGRVLYSALSRYLQAHPASSRSERLTIVETGTARGFSALCMAKALRDQDRAGVIVTLDVLPHIAPMYWNCIDDWDRGALTRAQLLHPWRDLLNNYIIFHQGDTKLELPKVQVDRIHFAFLDGAHTFEDVMFEFEQIRDRQQSGDMIVYDDYTHSQFPGLVAAVDKICSEYGYRRADLQAHTGRGYVVASKS